MSTLTAYPIPSTQPPTQPPHPTHSPKSPPNPPTQLTTQPTHPTHHPTHSPNSPPNPTTHPPHQAHVKLHLVTPAAYESPSAAVATRLLLRIAEDALLPEVYLADLAGTHCSMAAEETGVKLSLCGFPDVLGELLPRVLRALAGVGWFGGERALSGIGLVPGFHLSGRNINFARVDLQLLFVI